MPSALFGRRVAVILQPAIFVGVGKDRKLAGPWDSVVPYPGFNPVASLRVTFDVQKTIGAEPNQATVIIYNINAQNRAAPKSGDLLTLRAGYAADLVGDAGPEQLPIVFKGNVSRAMTTREGANWATKMTCGDLAHKKAKALDYLPAGSTIDAVVNRLKDKLKDFGTEVMSDLGSSVAWWLSNQFNRQTGAASSDGAAAATAGVLDKGRAMVGKVADLLTNEMDSIGLAWSVQDNVLIVRPKGGANPEPAIVLSPATGLVGSPGVTERGGVTGKTLLIGGMTPGRLVRIESSAVTGEYVLTRVSPRGDTHGPDWTMDFEADVAGARITLGGA